MRADYCIRILILRIKVSRLRFHRDGYGQTLVHSKNVLRPWSRANCSRFGWFLLWCTDLLALKPHHVD